MQLKGLCSQCPKTRPKRLAAEDLPREQAWQVIDAETGYPAPLRGPGAAAENCPTFGRFRQPRPSGANLFSQESRGRT